jgi:hypothetical protein
MVTVLRTPVAKAPANPGPSLFGDPIPVVLRMRKPEAAVVAARNDPAAEPMEMPARLVCLALLLAIAALTCRIASLW